MDFTHEDSAPIEVDIPLKNLKNHPKNNYKPNEHAIDNVTADIKVNGQKVALVCIEDKDIPGNYLVISGGGVRLPALIKAGKETARCIIRKDIKEEYITDEIRSYNKGRTKCQYDIAWEFHDEYLSMGRKAGQRTDIDETDKGKTFDLIAKESSPRVSGDQVRKYIYIYNNRIDFLDLAERHILSINAAANLIKFIKVYLEKDKSEGDLDDLSLEYIANCLGKEVDGSKYIPVNKRGDNLEEISEEVIKEYAKKLSARRKEAVKATGEKPEPTETKPANIIESQQPTSTDKVPEGGNETGKDDGEVEKETSPKTVSSSATPEPQKLADQQVEPKQLYIKVGPDQYELYTCSCKDCPNKCTQIK